MKYPPGPAGVSIRHFLALRRQPLATMCALWHEYGDLAHVRFGPQHVYLVCEPELIQQILVTRSRQFIKGRVLQKAKRVLGEGLLTSEGEHHLRQRRLVQPAFHRDRLIGYAGQMVECATRHRDRWRDGETSDVADDMMRLTLAIVGQTLFSADVESEAAEIGMALTRIVSAFDRFMLPWYELLEKLPTRRARETREARTTLDRIIYGLIEERRRSGVDHGDLLSMLLLAQDDEGDGKGMTDQQVRDEALTLFLAGHETTANALTWTWYLLSQHPEARQRMEEEIDRELNGRLPSFEDLPRLRFTEAVMAESMRLYPPAWTVARMNPEPYAFGEFTAPERSLFIMPVAILHRHPKYWPEPDRFWPERWEKKDEARPKFAYFPFGGGPRLCVGERFAWMEGVLLLAVIAQRWRLELEPGHPVEELPQITLRPKHGMRMRRFAR
ncbi:MAG: cytochrome P450 [Bryobacteraceae bacterium]|nr:cytochrome P450 [Bryobacteraceae bacterium]